ncbi:MAG: hypothetical protein ACF8R7_11500 [Phycisphaerales bacterium JB039]
MPLTPTHRLCATPAGPGAIEIPPLSPEAASLWFWTGNLLRQAPPRTPGPLLCWSGWLTEDADPEAGWFGPDPRIWGPGAWQRLGEAIVEARDRGIDLLLRPHPRHVLSDASRWQRMAREAGARLVAEPLALLTGSMLDDLDDHLARTLAVMTHGAGPAAWLLAGAAPVDRDPELLRPCPPQQSCVPMDRVLASIPEVGAAPVILLDGPGA